MNKPVPQPGDIVVSLTSPGGEPGPHSMKGQVLKTWTAGLSGGNRAMLRVRWENNHVGRIQERMVRIVDE